MSRLTASGKDFVSDRDWENMQRKIAFVTNICSHYVIRLFELLSERVKVDFFFTGGYEDYWDKKNQLWLGNFNGRYLKGFLIFPKIKITPGLFRLSSREYDVFIKTIEDRFALPFVFLLAKIQRKPFILWTQMWMHPQSRFHKFSYVFMKYIYRHSDAIIVYGSHVRDYLVNLGVPDDKIFCAPHTVDNEFFRKPVSDQQKQDLKKSLGLSAEKIILFVGRFEECKGLSYLIEAVSMIEDVDYCLVFIGTGSMKTSFEEQCKRSAVRYLFLSHIPNQDLYRYYAIADIFTLPSITTAEFKEPWGVVVNEAMNQGCPVVATDAVGAAAGGLVEDGKNGFIVPERDSLALKTAMETLLKDDDLRRRMGREARDKIERWGGSEQTVLGFIEAIEFVRGKKACKDT